jgi:hypothetical protein
VVERFTTRKKYQCSGHDGQTSDSSYTNTVAHRMLISDRVRNPITNRLPQKRIDPSSVFRALKEFRRKFAPLTLGDISFASAEDSSDSNERQVCINRSSWLRKTAMWLCDRIELCVHDKYKPEQGRAKESSGLIRLPFVILE